MRTGMPNDRHAGRRNCKNRLPGKIHNPHPIKIHSPGPIKN